MSLELLRSQLFKEFIADFLYVDHKSISLPASKILIGTNGSLDDASLYENTGSTIADITFGVAVNGLDTGAEAQDQWYAVYAVPNGTGFQLRFSASAPHAAGGTGPVGFSKYRYLGLVKNGGNSWDATNGSYGRGDFVHFVKKGRVTHFQAFHTNNGGLYPSVVGFQSIIVYVANSSTNGIVFDGSNAGYFGFQGSGPGGGVRLPYKFTSYLWHCAINSNSVASMIFEDASGNTRHGHTLGSNSGATLFAGEIWNDLSINDNWVAAIRLNNNNNSNVSRMLGVRGMVDPYIIGKGN